MAKFSPREFMHPEDEKALRHLESVPGFPQFTKLFMKVVNERMLHGTYMAQKIRLGPDQLPEYYELLPPICEMLGIAEPEFYLEMKSDPNAYTTGDTLTFITVTSGLIECMDREEIRAVLAHECGHIVCRHVLYKTMLMFMIQGAASLGVIAGLLTKPILAALMYWNRRSEMSSDRAAAVVLGDPSEMVETMIRFAGGPKAITKTVNVDRYVAQAEEYDQLIKGSTWDKVLQGVAAMEQSHPFPAVRARELLKWAETDDFKRLVAYARDETPTCSGCGTNLDPAWKFCNSCGVVV